MATTQELYGIWCQFGITPEQVKIRANVITARSAWREGSDVLDAAAGADETETTLCYDSYLDAPEAIQQATRELLAEMMEA